MILGIFGRVSQIGLLVHCRLGLGSFVGLGHHLSWVLRCCRLECLFLAVTFFLILLDSLTTTLVFAVILLFFVLVVVLFIIALLAVFLFLGHLQRCDFNSDRVEKHILPCLELPVEPLLTQSDRSSGNRRDILRKC